MKSLARGIALIALSGACGSVWACSDEAASPTATSCVSTPPGQPLDQTLRGEVDPRVQAGAAQLQAALSPAEFDYLSKLDWKARGDAILADPTFQKAYAVVVKNIGGYCITGGAPASTKNFSIRPLSNGAGCGSPVSTIVDVLATGAVAGAGYTIVAAAAVTPGVNVAVVMFAVVAAVVFVDSNRACGADLPPAGDCADPSSCPRPGPSEADSGADAGDSGDAADARLDAADASTGKCASVVCAGPAPLCVDGNAATRTESCRDSDGACVSSTTVTKVCAAPTRTCNGPLLTMTTESCAVGACASNTTVVQDCASQPARSATCASATQRTAYTPTCKTTAGAPTCDYAETTTACPAGQTCVAGSCSCQVQGELCFGNDKAGTPARCSDTSSSGIGVVFSFDGIASNNGSAPPGSGIGVPRDLRGFNNWCPFLSGAPGVPVPDPAMSSGQLVAPFCGDHVLVVTVSALACNGTPIWPATIYAAGVQFPAGATVTYFDSAGAVVTNFAFPGPGTQTFTARFN